MVILIFVHSRKIYLRHKNSQQNLVVAGHGWFGGCLLDCLMKATAPVNHCRVYLWLRARQRTSNMACGVVGSLWLSPDRGK